MWGYQSAFEAFELKNGVNQSPDTPNVTTDELDELYQRIANERGVESIIEG